MSELTRNQLFHLILSDIAMAMAVKTLNAGDIDGDKDYAPGAMRDGWLAKIEDKLLKQRVIALANAGMGSLISLDGPGLLDKAQRFGVPMDDDLAGQIAQHFTDKRDAVLTYRR
jgi:hypothetical protein